ncbi:MAG: KpsF/GutQ family sugar-phosphate isomerase [Hyphomonadaceae bacterium]|nr:KpsF/GutQ family sugar-phosphate isomerase [Hyphomonadaceae bacterium]
MSDARLISVEVLETEKAGLEALIDALSSDDTPLATAMIAAVQTIFDAKGRTIVTGMGKSGHVARKIAATLASTGTSALYVHPGEASHGDLGMIEDEDVVIALSNSGETPELGDIIGYCGRFDIPLIGMTSGADSTLAEASNIRLIVPKSPEACGITKAPTTSTTQMLALGDALSVALLRKKGFSQRDFHTFHPGGKLGAALKRVTDLMHHKQMPLCDPETPFSSIVTTITDGGFGCCGVVENERLIGIITDGDIRRALAGDATTQDAGNLMTRNPRTIQEDGLAAEALSMLSEHKITALFIVNAEQVPVGLLHVHDCLAIGVV